MPPESEPQSRACSKCKQIWPIDNFYRNKSMPGGRSWWCKPCQNQATAKYNKTDKRRTYQREYKRKQYAEDPERVKSVHYAWVRDNPDRVRVHDWRKKAKRRRAPRVNFTAEQLAAKHEYWGNKCWMCGNPADHNDHVKPLNKGGWHMLANIRPACISCNSSKRDTWPFPVTKAPA